MSGRVQKGLEGLESLEGSRRVQEGPGRVLEESWKGPGRVLEGSGKGTGRVWEGSGKGLGVVGS